METFALVLFLAISVLASSVISQFLSKVPTALVQIAMGLAIAFLASEQIEIKLDPELFLVLFIAPLLYDEARNANLGDLWHHRRAILVYAIGLVIAIVLAVGLSLHTLIPAIPLAAAFALGAALGPTDAVAVAEVTRQTTISTRNRAILKGEALLNDASGLVSFQFAVAAVVTGGFSLRDAGTEFLIMFFGGIAFGLVFGFAINLIVDLVRDAGLQDTTFHVLLELCVPFLAYLAAEHLGVSGIIAVVVTGIVNVVTPRTNGVALSRASIVSTSVWKVLAFALNGVVFVLLGTQLPGAMQSAWTDYSFSNELLFGLVPLITAALIAVRFIFSLGVEYLAMRGDHEKDAFGWDNVRSAMVLTLCGAKGAITLSIMFTLPWTVTSAVGAVSIFPYRNVLIFLACGVIITTLLLATFVVPLLAPKKEVKESEQQRHERDTEALVEILREVIEELTERQTKETSRATASVIAAYNDRIQRIKDDYDFDEEKDTALRLRCIAWEKDFLYDQMRTGQILESVGYEMTIRLSRREELLMHGGWRLAVRNALRRLMMGQRKIVRQIQHKVPFLEPSEHAMQVRAVQMKLYTYVIDRLQQEMSSMEESSENIAGLVLEYQRLRSQLQMTMPSVTAMAKVSDKADEIELLALRLELKFILEAAEKGELSKSYAKRARENVYLMQIDLEDRI